MAHACIIPKKTTNTPTIDTLVYPFLLNYRPGVRVLATPTGRIPTVLSTMGAFTG